MFNIILIHLGAPSAKHFLVYYICILLLGGVLNKWQTDNVNLLLNYLMSNLLEVSPDNIPEAK